ncbi:MAG: MlaD family protein, partial [Polyangiaceae bacterium]
MPEWTQAAKVGVFSLVLVGAAGGIYAYIGKARLGAKGITVYATFRDSTGLANFSRVTMAGIPIGSISGIGLTERGKARVQIKLDKGVILHRDTTIAKQTATLLSEPFLGVTPGSIDQPQLVDGDEIAFVVEPVTTDQILSDVAAITNNVKQITGSLANSIGSKEGEAEMKAILKNVEAATQELAAISRENRQTIRSTFQNVEAVTADVRRQTPQVLENVKSATGRVDRILAQNEPDLRSTLANTRSITEKADRATTSLESTLLHVDHIADRIDRGEGT